MMFGFTVGMVHRFNPLRPFSAPVARLAGLVLVALAPLLAPTPARAQVESITPAYVVVERENVPIQCRVGSASYPVKTVTVGQILRADGQTSSMYRVDYPAGMNAFVKIEEASFQADAKNVTLTRPSRLMAPNAEGGVSWWYLLEKELDAGTSLKVEKTVKGPDGKDSGYLVPAPAGSKGYIRRDYVRQATQAEIDTFLGKAAVPPAATPPAVTPPADKPKPPTETPPAKPVVEAPKTSDTPPPPPQPIDPNAPGVTTIKVKPADGTAPPETTPPGVTPPAPTPPGVTPPVEITTPAHTAPPAVKPAPAAMKAVDAETLTKLYTEALKTPLDQVELDAVIAEFQRTIDSLATDPSSARLRNQLDARVRVLRMRADLQTSLRQTTASSDSLKQQADQMKDELRRLDSLRQYTVVGRLVASSVYDGRTLPLMYRVLSPEPTSTRTLAYVAPDATASLIDKLGKLVGVVGDSRFDESLRVNIIVPTRVELLGAVSAPAPTPPPAPTPASEPVRTGSGPGTAAPVDQNK